MQTHSELHSLSPSKQQDYVACRPCFKERILPATWTHICNTEGPGCVMEPWIYPDMPRNYQRGGTHTGDAAALLKANFEIQQSNGKAIFIYQNNAINEPQIAQLSHNRQTKKKLFKNSLKV